jgi:hypothetical protein
MAKRAPELHREIFAATPTAFAFEFQRGALLLGDAEIQSLEIDQAVMGHRWQRGERGGEAVAGRATCSSFQPEHFPGRQCAGLDAEVEQQWRAIAGKRTLAHVHAGGDGGQARRSGGAARQPREQRFEFVQVQMRRGHVHALDGGLAMQQRTPRHHDGGAGRLQHRPAGTGVGQAETLQLHAGAWEQGGFGRCLQAQPQADRRKVVFQQGREAGGLQQVVDVHGRRDRQRSQDRDDRQRDPAQEVPRRWRGGRHGQPPTGSSPSTKARASKTRMSSARSPRPT